MPCATCAVFVTLQADVPCTGSEMPAATATKGSFDQTVCEKSSLQENRFPEWIGERERL